MKMVEKIDIKREFLCVDDQLDCIDFYIKNTVGRFTNPSEAMVANPDIKKERYCIYMYQDLNNIRFFALKDKDIYDILLRISVDKYKDDVENSYIKGKTEGINTTIKRIQSLSWWKRLINKF